MSLKRSYRKWPACRKCGSDLTNREKTETNGAGRQVDVFLCRCGARKRVPARG